MKSYAVIFQSNCYIEYALTDAVSSQSLFLGCRAMHQLPLDFDISIFEVLHNIYYFQTVLDSTIHSHFWSVYLFFFLV